MCFVTPNKFIHSSGVLKDYKEKMNFIGMSHAYG
jgi:hypothetical protein